MNVITLILLLIVSLLEARVAVAEVLLSGSVQTVVSGDQLVLFHPELGLQPIRLVQIDAPEMATGACKAQAWAEIAQKALAQQVLGATIQAYCLEKRDGDGFALCQLVVNGDSVNQWMLAQGHAWFDKSLGNNIWLQQLEQEAKRKRLGLWGNKASAVPPWLQRAQCSGKQH